MGLGLALWFHSACSSSPRFSAFHIIHVPH